MKKQTIGRIAAFSALGLLFAVLTNLLLSAALFALLPPVLAMLLYAWGGPVPMCVYAAASCAVCNIYVSQFTDTAAAMLTGLYALVCFLPVLILLCTVHARKSYVTCMRASVIGALGSMLAALLILWARIRMDIVDALMKAFSDMLLKFPSRMLDSVLIAYGRTGLLPTGTTLVDFAKDTLTSAERVEVVGLYIAAMSDSLKLALPGMLLTSCTIGGMAAVAFPFWIWARRGDEFGSRRMPLAQWRVPHNAAIGLPLCMLISFILNRTGMNGAEAAYIAIWNVFKLLLTLQAMGALSRKFAQSGTTRAKRIILIVLMLVFAQPIMVLIGIASLYFGSQGLISSYIRNRMDKNKQD